MMEKTWGKILIYLLDYGILPILIYCINPEFLQNENQPYTFSLIKW